MNNIRQIQSLNKRELENAVPPEASWHADYRDTAYIYIGGLPFDLSEGDIITIFSQFGEPVHVSLARDKETGKSRGFAFLKYEDQRSTDLAVDNLSGATVLGRTIRVDHTRYKKKEDEEEQDSVPWLMGDQNSKDDGRRKRKRGSSKEAPNRPLLKEEMELEKLLRDHDEDDPMKEFLIQQKREEVKFALEKTKEAERKSSRRSEGSRERSSHRHRHHHRRRHGDSPHSKEEGHRGHRKSRVGKSYGDESRERPNSAESQRHRDRRDYHQ